MEEVEKAMEKGKNKQVLEEKMTGRKFRLLYRQRAEQKKLNSSENAAEKEAEVAQEEDHQVIENNDHHEETTVKDAQRASDQTSLPNYGETNGSIPLHPQPLNVASISCVPHTGPPLPYGYHASSSKHINSQQHAGSQPAMVFFSACPVREEWDNLINHANGGVALTGSALLGKVGPFIGSVDIAESEDDYLFRVSLPGVTRDEKVFRCDVEPDGRILIKGESVTGESKVCRHNMVFKMQTQNLCPPGEFTVSFQLPGPIDHLNLSCVFGSDGIFEGVVKKKTQQVL